MTKEKTKQNRQTDKQQSTFYNIETKTKQCEPKS